MRARRARRLETWWPLMARHLRRDVMGYFCVYRLNSRPRKEPLFDLDSSGLDELGQLIGLGTQKSREFLGRIATGLAANCMR